DVLWDGMNVARLRRGDALVAPRIDPLASDLLDGVGRERLRRRLAAWLENEIRRRLGPLVRLRDAALSGPGRGLAFQLVEAGGLLPARQAAAQLRALSPEDRR